MKKKDTCTRAAKPIRRWQNVLLRFCSGKCVEYFTFCECDFEQIQKTVPAVVLLALPGVSGLNVAEHLRSLYPGCGVIWCSDLDFSLHAFRLRVEYFFMEPVDEQKIREGFSVWLKHSKAM